MNILFRADGNARIGAGHVMRCLALAHVAQDNGGRAVFLSSDLANAYATRLKNEHCTVLALTQTPYGKEDAEETLRLARENDAKWIVLDGYDFTSEYQQWIRDRGIKLLVIDDYFFKKEHTADILLNQNPKGNEDYTSIETGEVLHGSKFTMLRREYRTLCSRGSPASAEPAPTKNILITMGGSDPENLTPKVIRALKTIKILYNLTILIGGANPNKEEIINIAEDAEVFEDVADMPALLATQDIAISAAGSTCYELAYMGIPALTITVAENQRVVAEGLAKEGAIIDLGWHSNVTEKRIAEETEKLLADKKSQKKMREIGQRIIDGEGSNRVLMHMTGNRLRLRTVRDDDCKQVWEWANDPEIRKASFSSDPIPWEDHTKWFAKKMNDPSHYFYIAFNESDEPVGQIRFDCKGSDATISVSIEPQMRGKKYGVELITLGCKQLFAASESDVIHAYIKPENSASVAAFQKSGFTESDPTEENGKPALHYIVKRDMLPL